MLGRMHKWVGFQRVVRLWNSLRRNAAYTYSLPTPTEWVHLSLLAGFGLFLYVYVNIRQDIDATGIALLLSFIGWSLVATRKRWDWAIWVVLIAIVVAVGPSLAFDNWDVLHDDDKDSVITTIRNLALIIGGIIAVLLAIWRSTVSERQADTAQQSLLNERYQKGAEMLGGAALSVRMGGIYALERLAADHPEQYHVQVMQLLCAFARQPTEDEDYQRRLDNLPSPREDVIAAVNAIGSRDETRVKIEKSRDFELNLMGIDLSNAQIEDANLSGARLNDANLTNTNIFSVNLSGAYLHRTIMKNAKLTDIDFTDASASGIDLSGAEVFQHGKALFDLNYANLSPAQLPDGTLSLTQLLDVDLSGKSINNAKLHSVQIINSDLSNTHFLDSKLPQARILKSDLSGAEILRTDMSDAQIRQVNLSGTYFYHPSGKDPTSPVTGLTQARLDEACADPGNPPRLDGVVMDAETKEPLVWRGKPCED